MNKINSYKELLVWQNAMELVILVYDIVKTFPDTEKFGLVNQMTRAAVSIPANIAEGWGSIKEERSSIFENQQRFNHGIRNDNRTFK